VCRACSLVEELQVSAGATDAMVRLLYLTNMQAQLFNAETVPKMMNTFEVKQSSLVINLMDSYWYPISFETDTYKRWTREDWDATADDHLIESHNCAGFTGPFASREEATLATRRLANFFKEVLLPLAAETNAILLCSAQNGCILSSILAEVMPLFSARYGGKLPFTVFGVGPAVNFTWNARVENAPNSLACELSTKSKNWQKGLGKMEAAAHKLYGASWSRTDVQPGLGNYLIVECVSGRSSDRWHVDKGPLVSFQNELLQALASQLPVLCVRTGGSNSSNPLSANVQLASRDIPVLMLDAQSRPSLGVTMSPTSDSKVRDALIDKAIEINVARHEELWELDKVQCLDQHDLAYFFGILHDDGRSATTLLVTDDEATGRMQTLYASLKTAEQLKTMGNGPSAFTPAQLERVVNHLVEMMTQSFVRGVPAGHESKLGEKQGIDPVEYWAKKMETIWSVYYDVFKSKRLYGANLEDLGAVQTLIDQIVKRDRLPSNNSLEAQQSLRDAWNTVDICVYNATHYKRLAKATFVLCLLLGTIVIVLTVSKSHIDGTVVSQTLTCTLRSQPNETSTCEAHEEDTFDTSFTTATGIFMTAALLTIITGMNTFYDPSRRWRELRAIAESMQSDVFQFRTRTGRYAISRAEPRGPEQLFIRRIQDARVEVVQLAGLTESSFTRKYKNKVYRHGQNQNSSVDAFQIGKLSEDAPIHIEDGSRGGSVIDNHHSPMCVQHHSGAVHTIAATLYTVA
jgi:hypothetical protein